MTQAEFAVWMEEEDKKLRNFDWDYYFNRGVMELLTPLLEAREGTDMAGYLQAMEDYIELRNWTIYEEGRRLGKAFAAEEMTIDQSAAMVSLGRILVDPPVSKELAALRARVLDKGKGEYFELYQRAAYEAWEYQGIHAALYGLRDGGADVEWMRETFGRPVEGKNG